MTSKEELIRRRIEDAKQRMQSTVERRPKISRSESMAARGASGSDANEEVPSSLSRARRASLDNKDDVHSLHGSLSAEQLLQRRLQEARARVRSKVHEAADNAPRSNTPTGARRRASLPKLLQQHMSSDTMASVAQSYVISPGDNVHLYETDTALHALPSPPIWPVSRSGSATSTSRTVRSASESSSDESLSISRLGDSMLLDEVAMELASSATRNHDSGDITITAGGNLKSCGKYGVGDDDDDSFQGSITKTVPLSRANRVDGKDDICMFMKKFSI